MFKTLLFQTFNLILVCILFSGCNGEINIKIDKKGKGALRTFSLGGIISLGPVEDATITCWRIDDQGNKLNSCGSAISQKGGVFTIDVEEPNGPFILEASGGNYLDEGDLAFRSINPGEEISVLFKSEEEAQSIHDDKVGKTDTIKQIGITPFTTIAHKLAIKHVKQGGKTLDEGIDTAQSAVAPIAGYNLRHAVGNVYETNITYTKPDEPVVEWCPPDDPDFDMEAALWPDNKKNMTTKVAAFAVAANRMDVTQSQLIEQLANEGYTAGNIGTNLIEIQVDDMVYLYPSFNSVMKISQCFYTKDQVELKNSYQNDMLLLEADFVKAKSMNTMDLLFAFADYLLPKAHAQDIAVEEPIFIVEQPCCEVAKEAPYTMTDPDTGKTMEIDPTLIENTDAEDNDCGFIDWANRKVYLRHINDYGF